MDGHVVKLVHGYGYEPMIKIDKTLLKNVKSYNISGKTGELPEVTVSLIATSVIAEVAINARAESR